jgi:hypothetical protein
MGPKKKASLKDLEGVVAATSAADAPLAALPDAKKRKSAAAADEAEYIANSKRSKRGAKSKESNQELAPGSDVNDQRARAAAWAESQALASGNTGITDTVKTRQPTRKKAEATIQLVPSTNSAALSPKSSRLAEERERAAAWAAKQLPGAGVTSSKKPSPSRLLSITSSVSSNFQTARRDAPNYGLINQREESQDEDDTATDMATRLSGPRRTYVRGASKPTSSSIIHSTTTTSSKSEPFSINRRLFLNRQPSSSSLAEDSTNEDASPSLKPHQSKVNDQNYQNFKPIVIFYSLGMVFTFALTVAAVIYWHDADDIISPSTRAALIETLLPYVTKLKMRMLDLYVSVAWVWVGRGLAVAAGNAICIAVIARYLRNSSNKKDTSEETTQPADSEPSESSAKVAMFSAPSDADQESPSSTDGSSPTRKSGPAASSLLKSIDWSRVRSAAILAAVTTIGITYSDYVVMLAVFVWHHPYLSFIAVALIVALVLYYRYRSLHKESMKIQASYLAIITKNLIKEHHINEHCPIDFVFEELLDAVIDGSWQRYAKTIDNEDMKASTINNNFIAKLNRSKLTSLWPYVKVAVEEDRRIQVGDSLIHGGYKKCWRLVPFVVNRRQSL